MSFFSKIFSSSDSKEGMKKVVRFGRYTDCNKSREQLDHWDKSVSLYKQKKYSDSFESFLKYLRDDTIENLSFSREGNELKFTLIQGSKIVTGSANENKIIAEAHLLDFEKAPVPLMRKLLEMNFGLQYSRFSIVDKTVVLKFDSPLEDASPDKLYYSLKEVAITSDKQDDLLTSEFKSLQNIGTDHITILTEQEKEIKYRYFRLWTESTLKRASELDEEKHSGAISYLFLALIYKIDYLLSPEGNLLHELEKMQAIYYDKENKPAITKNRNLKEVFQKLSDSPKENIIADFYNVKATFGIINPAVFQSIADFIFTEADKTTWYRDNNMPDIELAAYEFIAGYCFFNFGMYESCNELLHLLMQIINPEYFKEIGHKEKYYDPKNNNFDKFAIEDEINKILKRGRSRFPHLMFLVTNLRYNSRPDFCASFLKEFDFLNFTDALY